MCFVPEIALRVFPLARMLDEHEIAIVVHEVSYRELDQEEWEAEAMP